MDALKGRVVVLDFWTSCCINCLQTLPTLKHVEEAFAKDPVVVIGVHSPKFDAEQEAARLRSVIRSYDIRHPVAVDANMSIWKTWGVESWPSVIVLDTEGRLVWAGAGEPDESKLRGIIAAALAEGQKAGRLATGPLPGLRVDQTAPTPLSFPGKVATLADGSVAVADTGHHRIVLLDRNGKTQTVIGSGLAGRLDGAYAEASFRAPQGISARGDLLYVADTENHLLRVIDRKAKTVTTLAGTGELGRGALDEQETPALRQALRSPWDVLVDGSRLFVALAGSHQIAVVDLDKKTIRRFAGSGQEARQDGNANDAAFAQPSALTTDGKTLFVLDSETSSVRAVDRQTGRTRTVVGRDLFVFGDVDGNAEKARLQHPLGLAYASGALWVADSYNGKIKRVDPKTGETKSVAGNRTSLFEPGGLAVRGNELLIADTHHQRLARVAFLGADRSVQPFDVAGLEPPSSGVAVAAQAQATIDPKDPEARVSFRVPGGKAATLRLMWKIPAGTAINDDAPLKVRWAQSDGVMSPPADVKTVGRDAREGLDLSVQPKADVKQAKLDGILDVILCDVATHKVCVPVRRTLRAEIAVAGDAPQTSATVELPAAKP